MSMQDDIEYIRRRVDDIYKEVGSHESRISVIESHLGIGKNGSGRGPRHDDRSVTNGVIILAIASIVISTVALLYHILV